MIRLHIDGQLTLEKQYSANNAVFDEDVEIPPQARILIAVAIDEQGLFSTSNPIELPPSKGGGGKLVGLIVGVDHYNPKGLDLSYASSDATRILQAISKNSSDYYGKIDLKPLLNEDAKVEVIARELRTLVATAGQNDTILFFFSGHGLRGADGQFYLASNGISFSDPVGTGLPWALVSSILSASKARVLVMLDACHSGAASAGGIETNDQLAPEILKIGVPLVVLAAAKGRQYAYEDNPKRPPQWNGGAFAAAIVDTLGPGKKLADKNQDGVLEVSEFYFALKQKVTAETEGGNLGVQTPWIERRNTFGDFPLF